MRVVILRGEGKHFSYGLDLPAMAAEMGPLFTGENLARGRMRLHRRIVEMQGAGNSIAACPKPVLGVVSGWCIGGGLDLLAACDVRLCSADARFSLREVKLAMVADVGSLQRLPAIIGDGHTRELAFTGKDIDAARALRIGLVNDVFETPEALLAAARSMAGEIARNPPLVVQGVKQVLNYSAGKTAADGLAFVAAWNAAFLQSHDLAEGLAAFAERRPPRFKGA